VNTFREKVASVIDKIKSSKKLSLLAIILLIAAIPLTVFIAQTAQDVRQQASVNLAQITLDKSSVKPGETVNVSWTIPQATDVPVSPTPVQCTPRPAITRTSTIASPGKINVAITAGNNTGRTDNVIKAFKLKTLTNVSVTIGAQTYTTASDTEIDIADVATTSIVINQITPGQTGTLVYDITDACGPYADTRGGGPTEWGNQANPTATPTNTPSPTSTPTPTPTPVPSVAVITMTPSSVRQGTPLAVGWNYTSGTPSVTDQIEVLTSTGVHAQSFYLSSCTTTPGTTVQATGQCPNSIPTSNYGPATYTVKLFKNADPSKVIGQSTFTVTATTGYNFPNSIIPKAYAQTAITGAETIQLFKNNENRGTPIAAGEKRYISLDNCPLQESITAPPATPKNSGNCSYPIPLNAVPGSYFFRMFAADGTTEIGVSLAIQVTPVDVTSCSTDADCASANETTNKKCWKSANYPGKCGGDACTGAIVYACDANNPASCDTFSTSCSVPIGWTPKADSNPKIIGVVFKDLNTNGVLEASDTRLPNETVYLSAPTTASIMGPTVIKTKTNANGEYSIYGSLEVGKAYRISHDIPAGYMRTTDNSVPFTLTAAGITHNFGITQITHKNGMISYWSMDTDSGITVVDDKGSNTATTAANTLVNGKIGKAHLLGGAANQFILIPNNTSLAPDKFTVSAWVYPTDANSFGQGNYASIFNRRNADNVGGMNLELEGDAGFTTGQMHCDFWVKKADGTVALARARTPVEKKLTPAAWNHVACSYDGTTVKLYMNGLVVATTQLAGVMNNPANPLTLIGQNIILKQNFKGKIDEVGLWNRTLTDFEISYLAFGGSPITEPPTTPSLTLTMVPPSVNKGTQTQVQFQYPSPITPTATDLFSVYKEGATPASFVPDTSESARVINFYASNCLATPTTASRASGACNIETSSMTPGRYSVRLFANNGFTQRLGIVEFTVTDPTPSTKFSSTISLTGIGSPSGTFAPLHTQRNAVITLFDTNNTLIATRTGAITYASASGNFVGTIQNRQDPIPAGNYLIKIQTPQFLNKQYPGIFAIQSTTNLALPSLFMTTGDINLDNRINILDYNLLRTCYGSKMSTDICKQTPQYFAEPNNPLADLNDDGVVDGIDYNLFIRSLATKEGD